MRMREHRQKRGRKSDMTSEKLKAILIDIYRPKADFSIVLTDRKYKRRLGTYYPDRHRIYVHGGWGDDIMSLTTAIHEYAHHIHFTERSSGVYEKSHGQEFYLIHRALLAIAETKGYLTRGSVFK